MEANPWFSRDILNQPNHSLIWKEGSCSSCPIFSAWLHAFTAYFEAGIHQTHLHDLINSLVCSKISQHRTQQLSAGSAHRDGPEHQNQHRAGAGPRGWRPEMDGHKISPFSYKKPVIQLSSLGNHSFIMPVIDACPRLQGAKVSTLFTYMHLVKG